MKTEEYEVRWLIENEAVLLIQYKDMTVQQLGNMIREVGDLLAQSEKPKIPVVVDGTHMKATTNNMGQVVKEFRNVRSEKWGFTIVIDSKGIIKFIAQVILQVARVEVKFAGDMKEALDILYRMDPTLPRLSDDNATNL
ncbi:MAG: hypothetical protein SH821_17480 [Phototrophicales bacterium]|nr:hypothetical protein [Phototrophicales bacterium]